MTGGITGVSWCELQCCSWHVHPVWAAPLEPLCAVVCRLLTADNACVPQCLKVTLWASIDGLTRLKSMADYAVVARAVRHRERATAISVIVSHWQDGCLIRWWQAVLCKQGVDRWDQATQRRICELCVQWNGLTSRAETGSKPLPVSTGESQS